MIEKEVTIDEQFTHELAIINRWRRRVNRVMALMALATIVWHSAPTVNTMSKIDTDFAGGLKYHSTVYDGGKATVLDGSIDTIDPIEKDDPVIAQVLSELAPDQAVVAEADDGTRVEYYMLNKHISPENGVIVFNMGWKGDVQTETTHQELTYLISNLPEPKQVIVINIINTNPTKEVMDQMMSEGSFIPFGVSVDAGLAELLENYKSDKIEYWGHSEGARRAIAQAYAYYLRTGEPIAVLKALDPVGSHGQELLPFGLNSAKEEWLYSMMYDNSKYDLHLAVAQADKGLEQDNRYLSSFGAPNVMRRNGTTIDLGETITAGAARQIIVVSPELSAITNPSDVSEIISTTNIPYGTVVCHTMLEGHSHYPIGSGKSMAVETSSYANVGGACE
ncbi:hypothetical protein FWD20_02540 [Candidatus Saccharibacteria bacterium]|nr:hypothetical protein [Candidatus Saccharibacteria bacterium]